MGGVAEGAFNPVRTVGADHRLKFAGISPPLRPGTIIDVLFDATHAVRGNLGHHRDVAGNHEFAAFIPDQQGAGFRPAFGPVAQGLQRQLAAVLHPAKGPQLKNVIGHGDIAEDHPLGQVQPAPREFHALPLVAHENAIDGIAKGGAIGQRRLVDAIVIAGINRHAAGRISKDGSELGGGKKRTIWHGTRFSGNTDADDGCRPR